MRRGGLLALMVALGACLPGTAVGADSLQQIGQPQIERTGILLPGNWTSITGSSAVWDTPGWRGDYAWSVPPAIPPTGAPVSLYVKATDKVGGRFYPVIGVSGNVFIEGGDGVVTAGADLNAGKPTDEGRGTFTLVPGSYCDSCPITVTIGIQDGPRITFTYKVVPKPKGKPCKAGAITGIAQFNGPLLCHTDEPAPGKSGRVASPVLGSKAKTATVDVTSSAGNLSGTTLVGEAEASKRRADKIGTVVAACYLIGPDVFDYPKSRLDEAIDELIRQGRLAVGGGPAARLKNCIALALKLTERPGAGPSGRAAASGCRVRRIAFAGRKLAKSQRPSSSSVRYGCKRVRGGVKITVKRSQALRAAIGKKLDLGVVRAPRAPASGATLSFRFR